MNRYTHWSSNDLGDHEFPDEDDGDDDSIEVVECPSCGQDVYEEAVACPHCGEYITRSTSALAGRSWWWLALGLLGMFGVIWTSLAMLF